MSEDGGTRRIVVTGAGGFLGWHALVRLSTLAGVEAVPIDRAAFGGAELEAAVAEADAVLHLAGINRASTDEVHGGNVALAERLVAALESTGSRARVVYAGSTQADASDAERTPYGQGKRLAGERLAAWGARGGAPVTEVRLPGLYGEHGRPEYNSFVATFAHRTAAGTPPEVTGDRELPLLYVQDAVADLVAAAGEDDPPPLVRPAATTPLGISAVRDTLAGFHEVYARGEIPRLSSTVDVRLFNTLRAAMWDQGVRTIPLTPHADARGAFVEVTRQHGGQGQSSFSTTVPGVTRGNHFHFRKIERFVVVDGTGMIRLRKMATHEVVEIPVTGAEPVAVDMPTLWTHSIENVGSSGMLTLFWINELYDESDPDTHMAPVLTTC